MLQTYHALYNTPPPHLFSMSFMHFMKLQYKVCIKNNVWSIAKEGCDNNVIWVQTWDHIVLLQQYDNVKMDSLLLTNKWILKFQANPLAFHEIYAWNQVLHMRPPFSFIFIVTNPTLNSFMKNIIKMDLLILL